MYFLTVQYYTPIKWIPQKNPLQTLTIFRLEYKVIDWEAEIMLCPCSMSQEANKWMPPWTTFSASFILTANVMLSFLLLPLNSCHQNTTNYMKPKGGWKINIDSTSSSSSVLPVICPSCTAQEEYHPFSRLCLRLASYRKERVHACSDLSESMSP